MPDATAWLIFDQNYWEKLGIFGVTPGGEVPDYIHRADTLGELATEIGVGEVGLLRTVDRFDPEARLGRDPQFHRGETLFDRYFGAFYPRLGRYSPDARSPRRPGNGSPRRSVRSSTSSASFRERTSGRRLSAAMAAHPHMCR